MRILLWLLLSGLSGWLYRRGGTNKGTLWRDIGSMLCTMAVLIIWDSFVYNININSGIVLMALFTFGALTTYNKWVGKLFGRKDNEVHWESWLVTGFLYGLAALPFAFATQHWLGFILRTIFLGSSVTFWSESIGDAKWEETGRGVLLTFSIPLLLI